MTLLTLYEYARWIHTSTLLCTSLPTEFGSQVYLGRNEFQGRINRSGMYHKLFGHTSWSLNDMWQNLRAYVSTIFTSTIVHILCVEKNIACAPLNWPWKSIFKSSNKQKSSLWELHILEYKFKKPTSFSMKPSFVLLHT